MQPIYFTFNGVDSSALGISVMDGIRRDILMPVGPVGMRVPGRDGAYAAGQTRAERLIEIPIAFGSDTHEAAQELVRVLASWLVYRDPAPLILSDEPDRVYYAMLSGETQLQRVLTARAARLVFYVPDPYAYSPTATQHPMVMGVNTLNNPGNGVAFPTYRFQLKQSEGSSIAGSTFFSLRHPDTDSVIMCGAPDTVEETISSPTTRQLYESGDSMTGWQSGSLCEGGTATGTAVSNGYTISPKYTGGSYGTGSAWHGPCIIKSLAAPATDFYMAVKCGWTTLNANQMGRFEFWLLNGSSQVVAKIELGDSWVAYRQTRWLVKLGPIGGTRRTIALVDHTGGWNDMREGQHCRLTLERRGDRWACTIGRWYPPVNAYRWRMTEVAYDTRFSDDIAAVAVTFSAHGSHVTPTYHWMDWIYVDEFASTGSAVPILFVPGDEVLVDTARALLTKNGESMMPYMDITSQFFGLPSGDSDVEVTCGEGIEIDTEYADNGAWVQERWL